MFYKNIEIMNIEEIKIGKKYEDTLGKAIYSKKGNLMKGRDKREVLITNKTSNSIEYLDEGRFVSWIGFEEFVRVERSVGKMRFVNVE